MLHADDRGKPLEVPYARIVAGRIAQDAPDQMRMRVDESRHQGHVTEIDRLRICGNAHGSRGTDCGDRVVSDYYDRVVDGCSACSINQTRCFQYDNALPYRR